MKKIPWRHKYPSWKFHPERFNPIVLASGVPPRYLEVNLDEDFPDLDPFKAGEYIDNVIIYGDIGSGKTRFLSGMVRIFLQGYGYPAAIMISAVTLFDELLFELNGKRGERFNTYQEKLQWDRSGSEEQWSPSSIVTMLQNVELLVIDDLGSEKTTDWRMERLFSIIDHRYNHMLPTWVSCNFDIHEPETDNLKRIVSRLKSGKTIFFATREDRRKSND